jgi:ABC-type transport system substrate-binding protein
LFLVLAILGCTNNPYSEADAARKIYYTSFAEPPRTLDPAVAYTTSDHAVIGNVFDTLLEYHYLKRPYTLIPGLAAEVPRPRHDGGGRPFYLFELRDDLLYQDDPCFALAEPGRRTRRVTAADVAFALARIADPAVNSPVIENFEKIAGLESFGARLDSARQEDASFAALPAHEQYSRLGGIEGVRVLSPTRIEIALNEPYPQILYWFAMPFTAPLPWEAVAYYDGREGRDLLADHPVGTGPFRLVLYDKRSRIVLERNENWYGIRHPEWRAPGAVYPTEGAPGDERAGLLAPHLAGVALPFLERIEFRRESEAIPAFIKFLQGYYDVSGVGRESFDRVIHKGSLSPEMQSMGMRLDASVRPGIFYLGFNMDDAVVGTPARERGRALRQAMSLAIDAREYTRLFLNGRGVPAESPLPPGIFGYEEGYRNPFRSPDLERAAALLEEAGYPRGIDPATGQPLRLTFDAYFVQARALLEYEFFVESWRRIGLDVQVDATTYNQFQDKVRRGAYQIFYWGWVADYPDPENFLFLLWTPMGRTKSGGPNTANFSDPEYDRLFLEMKSRENDERRLEIIGAMRAILERERPWIELLYPEDYLLSHAWLSDAKPPGLSIPTAKYQDLQPEGRARLRAHWNRPILWPAYAIGVLVAAVVAPAFLRAVREARR